MFPKIKALPADPILGLSQLFAQETNPNKVDLGVGVYRNDSGKTPVMQAIKKAEQLLLAQQTSKAYLSSLGNSQFRSSIPALILGEDSSLYQDGKIAVAQTPAGTGAVRLAFDFIKECLNVNRIWVSNPSWGNHFGIAKGAGLETQKYAYVDAEKNTFEFEALKQDLEKIPQGEALLMHASCHNPTGFDPSFEQWQEIAKIVEKNQLILLLDSAYQGLGDGINQDARAMRMLTNKLPNILIASSCSKNFGLYRDRIGVLLIKTSDKEQTQSIESQLSSLIRAAFSSPPDHGAAVVAHILQSQDLYKLWEDELTQMRERTAKLRQDFLKQLEKYNLQQRFEFILAQKGMFSYTGLTKDQVAKLQKDYAIYMTGEGRINVAGLNERNINYVVDAIAEVLEGSN